MNNKKDLFELFRESEHKLNQRPSSDAWRRLESRLDERRASQKTNLFRQLLSIAALLILLATIAIAFSLQTNQSSKQTASNTPAILEDLTYSQSDNEPLKVIEFTRRHVSRLANPVAEGDADKKLKPKVQ